MSPVRESLTPTNLKPAGSVAHFQAIAVQTYIQDNVNVNVNSAKASQTMNPRLIQMCGV